MIFKHGQSIMPQKYYDGESLEWGKTAVSTTSVAPAVSWLFQHGHIVNGMRILDYGAGNGRNASFLRDNGCKVYAYDPYNGTHFPNGWSGVSTVLPDPREKYDLFLTCFVLNVVPKYLEDDIVNAGKMYSRKQIHITRNKDLLDYAHKALTSGEPSDVCTWYVHNYGGWHTNVLDWSDVQKFCNYGFTTRRGFQRDVHLWETHGMDIIHDRYGYKIFMN